MFCPTCGRDNAVGRKFCATCGTNLDVVSQALIGSDDDFFTKIDTGLDHFLARYAEHVFRNAPSNAAEQRISKSWQVLGQSALTSVVDLLLFTLMWNVIPLRFLLLVISTPIRLVAQRGKPRKPSLDAANKPVELPEAESHPWLAGQVGSVTEHTTAILANSERKK